LALEDRDDEHHRAALSVRERIRKSLTPFRTLFTSNYVTDETLTLLKDRCGVNVAISFRNDLEKSGIVKTLWIDRNVEAAAWKIFEKHQDKEYSFTDCTSFALTDLHAIRNAFTFDNHFRQYLLNVIP
jgi:uncharacterized protein